MLRLKAYIGDGVINVLPPMRRRLPWLYHIVANEWLFRDMHKDALWGSGWSTSEIVKRPNPAEGVQVLRRQ